MRKFEKSTINLGMARRIWKLETDYRALLAKLGHETHITCNCPTRETLPYDLDDLDNAIWRLRATRSKKYAI